MITDVNQVMWDTRTIRPQQHPRRRLYFLSKRVLDVVLASLALVFLSPLLLLIAVLIRLDSPGPAVYKQKRMGYDWRNRKKSPFVILKFRSMYQNSDENVHKQYVHDWISGKVDTSQEMAKLADDQRVTKLGRLLRRTSLDELPQLVNILHGDMSVVGPRPVPLYEVDEYKPWQAQRLETTPGLTGLWQVKGRGRVTADEMATLDIEYINHQSLWLDIKIMAMTIWATISGRGAA